MPARVETTLCTLCLSSAVSKKRWLVAARGVRTDRHKRWQIACSFPIQKSHWPAVQPHRLVPRSRHHCVWKWLDGIEISLSNLILDIQPS